jgi:hypothetical protein
MLFARRKPIDIREILLEVSQIRLSEAPGVSRSERRCGRERRSGMDRRRGVNPTHDLPEFFKENRTGLERRSGYDRRGFDSM